MVFTRKKNIKLFYSSFSCFCLFSCAWIPCLSFSLCASHSFLSLNFHFAHWLLCLLFSLPFRQLLIDSLLLFCFKRFLLSLYGTARQGKAERGQFRFACFLSRWGVNKHRRCNFVNVKVVKLKLTSNNFKNHFDMLLILLSAVAKCISKQRPKYYKQHCRSRFKTPNEISFRINRPIDR